MAGVKRGRRSGEFGRASACGARPTRSRPPKFPLPLLTPATQGTAVGEMSPCLGWNKKGARFWKVAVTFRAQNQLFKSNSEKKEKKEKKPILVDKPHFFLLTDSFIVIIYKTIETWTFNVNNNSFSGRYRVVRETGFRPRPGERQKSSLQ